MTKIQADGFKDYFYWSQRSQTIPEIIYLVPEDPSKIEKTAWQNPAGPKLIILQLDGMTRNLFSEGMKKNDLPAFKALLNKGTYGELKSCCNLLSPSVWTTVNTGLPPQEHGIWDFIEEDSDGAIYSTVSSGIQAPRLWDIYNDRGGKSLMGAVLLPDEEFDFLTGLQLPSKKIQRLMKVFNSDPTPLVVVYEPVADYTGHLWWWAYQPENFRKRGWDIPLEVEYFHKERLAQSYRMLDAYVAAALRLAGPDTTIIALSDHGFTSTFPKSQFSFFLNDFAKIAGVEGQQLPTESETELVFCAQNPEKMSTAIIEAVFENGESVFKMRSVEKSISCSSGQPVVCELNLPAVSKGYWNGYNILIAGEKIPVDRLFMIPNSGDHLEYGMFFIAGKNIKRGVDLQNPSVYDIMPNALAILDLPVGADMPGRIWDEVYETKPEKKMIPTYGRIHRKQIKIRTSPEELKRLKSLGYIK